MMTDGATAASNGPQPHAAAPEPAPGAKHVLFISHKHRDKEIADALRKFLTPWGQAVGLEIFQSSGFPADAPRPGRSLTDELRSAVSKSSLLVLVYTFKNLDYETCILECGIALDPALPQTNVVVLKCTGQELPEFVKGIVFVDMRDENSVKNFVRSLFTDTGYFAGATRALTELASTDSKVADAGDELFKNVQLVIPKDIDDEEWHPVPFLQLSLSLAEIDRVRVASEEEFELARKILESGALSVSAESLAGERVFEMLETIDRPLRDLLPAADAQGWVGVELAREVVRAARGAIPAGCRPVVDRYKKTLLPSLARYRRVASERCMRFDFYFIPIESSSTEEMPKAENTPVPTAAG
jgi:hypothetical protein